MAAGLYVVATRSCASFPLIVFFPAHTIEDCDEGAMVAGAGHFSSASSKVVATIFALAFLLQSCVNIHPLPDDVVHLSTYNIVRQVRCETRKAVIDSILGFLTSDANHEAKPPKVDDRSRAVGQGFLRAFRATPYDFAGPNSMQKFNPGILSGEAKIIVSLLWSTGVAYNFDLTMLEKNDFDPGVNFVGLWSRSGLSAGLNGNFDRQRQNERQFTITDNFGDLVGKLRPDYCKNQIVEANMTYPIAGKVGMERVVQDFLVLTLFGNLSGDASKDITASKGPPTMVEQLEFTTTVGGSTTPKVTFVSVGSGVHVADTSLGLSASRTDTHKLTTGLYLVPAGEKLLGETKPRIFQGLITAKGSAAERGAARAVDQFLEQKLNQTNIIIQR
ncbi:hypothetical protein [Rhizobium leguminosarum]|uniref:hypothetical protein n=1 Tax=Rhizobium leguminosarum TaxID=384 RepID=UPI001C9778BA|nr:hypothetical protein [Rhizobium leguminosarum]MBY5700178.1 hypothetical protein [Rhizobium leguminosarum]